MLQLYIPVLCQHEQVLIVSTCILYYNPRSYRVHSLRLPKCEARQTVQTNTFVRAGSDLPKLPK